MTEDPIDRWDVPEIRNKVTQILEYTFVFLWQYTTMKNDAQMADLMFMEKGLQSLRAARGFFNAAGVDVAVAHIDLLIADTHAEMDELIGANFKTATLERKRP